MFCASDLVFGGTEGVRTSLHVLRSRIRFRRYRGRRDQSSCFALSFLFSAVPSTPSLVFMFCAPRLILGDTEGVRSSFHFCAPGPILGGTEGAMSSFHILRSRTHFQLYRGRRVQFSCFTLPNSFPAVPRALSSVFMFCALGLVFGGTEGVGSSFHVLCSRTLFQRYQGHRVQFLYFKFPNSFWVVSRAPG
jgi:hypothetical protein